MFWVPETDRGVLSKNLKLSILISSVLSLNALKGKFYDLQARYDKLMLEQEEKTIEKSKTTTKKAKESEE